MAYLIEPLENIEKIFLEGNNERFYLWKNFNYGILVFIGKIKAALIV